VSGSSQRFDLRTHSFGSSWWLDRHSQTNYLVMDAINTTAIGTGSKQKRLWTRIGFVRARLSVLSGFAHQHDMVEQTFAAVLMFKSDGTPNLRLEKRLKKSVVGQRILLCTTSALHGTVNESLSILEPGVLLLSAAGTKGPREHLWLCEPDSVIHFTEYRLRVVISEQGWRFERER